MWFSILLKVNLLSELTKARILQLFDNPFPFVLYENQVLPQTLPTFFLSRSKEIVSDKLFTIRLWEESILESKIYFKCYITDFSNPDLTVALDIQKCSHLFALFPSLECVFFLDNRQIYLAL